MMGLDVSDTLRDDQDSHFHDSPCPVSQKSIDGVKISGARFACGMVSIMIIREFRNPFGD